LAVEDRCEQTAG